MHPYFFKTTILKIWHCCSFKKKGKHLYFPFMTFLQQYQKMLPANLPDFPRSILFFIALSRHPVSAVFFSIYDSITALFVLYTGNKWSPSTLKVCCFHTDNFTATPNALTRMGACSGSSAPNFRHHGNKNFDLVPKNAKERGILFQSRMRLVLMLITTDWKRKIAVTENQEQHSIVAIQAYDYVVISAN